MFRRLLIPTEVVDAPQPSWTIGIQLARLHGAEVLLLCVDTTPYYDVPYSNVPAAVEEQRRWTQARLDERASEAGRTGLTVRTLIRSGKLVDTIVDTARREAVDLVVLDAPPAGTSTAEHVVATAPCHVLAVKPTP